MSCRMTRHVKKVGRDKIPQIKVYRQKMGDGDPSISLNSQLGKILFKNCVE